MDSVINFFFEPYEVLNYTLNQDEKQNDKVLVEGGVLIYAFDVDTEGIVHLLYLLKEGDLVYKTLKDDTWTKAIISKFDTRSNYYGQLEILLINDKPHIFYCFANYISSNIFTLHHVVYDNENYEKNSIVRYIAKMESASFVVKNDSNGYIHLLYRTIVGNLSSVFYTNYNPYSNKWLAKSIKVSKDSTLNEDSYIFVDSLDNVHGIWWEYSSNGYLLKYSRMTTTGRNKFKWNEISITKSSFQSLFVLVKEKDERLLLSYGDKNAPSFMTSNDYGLTWNIDVEPLDEVPKVMEIEEDIDDSIDDGFNDNIKEIDNSNQLLDQVLLSQEEIKLIISNILEEQLSIKSRLTKIEETNSKSLFTRLFNSD